MKTIIKQWELPNGSDVILSDGTIIKFIKMDGMYAQWLQDGEIFIGNFDGFIKKKDHYVIAKDNN